MLQRVNDAQSLVVSLTSSGHAPQVRTSPLPDTLKRYQQFEVWYPKRVEELNRVAQGKLTPEEAQTVRAVHIETKPKGAMLAVDGKSIGNGPTDRELTIGPHQITAGKEKLTGQLDIVVFPDAPKKVKVDLH